MPTKTGKEILVLCGLDSDFSLNLHTESRLIDGQICFEE
jgi:hypothetical protein